MSGETPIRPTWADVDLGALLRNVERIKQRLPERARFCAVIKANAYGHGAVEAARALEPHVPMFAVALMEEAIELRRAGITAPVILVFGSTTAIDLALQHNLTLGIVGPEELAVVCEAARERDVHVHLKLDSGMGRMGVLESELPQAIAMIKATPRLHIDAIYTHMANADDLSDPFTEQQIANYDRMLATLREAGIDAPLHHFANSATTMRGLVRPGDIARVGIAMWGAGDFDGMEPVLRWRTEIVRLKTLPPGHAVGYGTTFHTSRESRIATLPCGYADGYNRLLSNCGEVWIRGQRAPIVGRVSMDLITIDVTDIPGAQLGDEVELLGANITAAELAAKLNTISYEVLCSITARVPRRYR